MPECYFNVIILAVPLLWNPCMVHTSFQDIRPPKVKPRPRSWVPFFSRFNQSQNWILTTLTDIIIPLTVQQWVEEERETSISILTFLLAHFAEVTRPGTGLKLTKTGAPPKLQDQEQDSNWPRPWSTYKWRGLSTAQVPSLVNVRRDAKPLRRRQAQVRVLHVRLVRELGEGRGSPSTQSLWG